MATKRKVIILGHSNSKLNNILKMPFTDRISVSTKLILDIHLNKL
mgnify:CR=1 FL=1